MESVLEYFFVPTGIARIQSGVAFLAVSNIYIMKVRRGWRMFEKVVFIKTVGRAQRIEGMQVPVVQLLLYRIFKRIIRRRRIIISIKISKRCRSTGL
jgi:hypothetical protein